MAQDRDPNLVTSGLSTVVTKGGVKLQVNILRLEHETEWSLEVVSPDGASTVWNDTFSSDEAAYAEFERTITEEGARTFLELAANVIPFKR
jgi:hypothetical protein